MLNPKNVGDLKKFFEENPYLSTYELAIMAGRSPSTIRNWKRKCGISLKESPFPKGREYSRRAIQSTTDQDIWDSRDWFVQKYEKEGLGIPTIARTIGRSVSLVAARLKRYSIPTRPHNEAVKSSNPFCSEEWLYAHYSGRDQYVEWCNRNVKQIDPEGGRGLSLAKCATIAGVVPYTIYNWLVHFKIPMRDINEAMAGEGNPFYGRKHSEETKRKIRDAYWAKRSQVNPTEGNA